MMQITHSDDRIENYSPQVDEVTVQDLDVHGIE